MMDSKRPRRIIQGFQNRNLLSPPLPLDLNLKALSRRPLRLATETLEVMMQRPIPLLAEVRRNAEPFRATVIVVTYNNLPVTRLCLESLLANTDELSFELTVVDNGSTDGTPEYLLRLARQSTRIRVITNDVNRGFAAANNQALARAEGKVLVLLNNDTVVPPEWLDRLVAHVEDESIGLVGPVTNRIGNEAEIQTNYSTYGEFLSFAERHLAGIRGQRFDIGTACMFCLAMRREVYEHLGSLDERYEVGLLEDDDYSMAARAAGYRVVCAEDVFVHHFGQASFGGLFASGEYGRLLEANKERFEEKWGVPWQPYGRRLGERYTQMHQRMREIIEQVVPPGAPVLIVSRGDEELVRIESVRASHFPQNEHGEYAGYYPANDAEAIAQLESLVRKGAEFVVFPQTAFWWLTHYSQFRDYVESTAKQVWSDEIAVIYKLSCQ
jgi:GT2 family glycosyltransferase